MSILGYNFYGETSFENLAVPIINIDTLELNNLIIDEIKIDEDTSISNTNYKANWGLFTRLLARFLNSLEAGNIENNGLQIVSFMVKRREIDEIEDTTVVTLENSEGLIEFTDYTQPNRRFVYSIVPVSENGLEGMPINTTIESDFVGYWIVDKDTNELFSFDTMIDTNNQTVQTKLNEGRIQLDTMSKYPTIYYIPQSYHEFTLSGGFIPSSFERSDTEYRRLLTLLSQRKSLIVKGSDGSIYVCDVNTPRKITPLNTWQGNDYVTIEVDCIEVMDYDEFMAGD